MNRIKFFLIACLLGMTTGAFAQFANSKSSSYNANTDGWQGLRVSYHPMSLVPDKGDNMGMTGFSAGYVKGISLSPQVPIFLEAGANLTWAFKNLTDNMEPEDDYLDDYSAKLNMLSINIPVNFGYKYDVNERFSIYPYIGVNFRINAIGKFKIGFEYDDKTENESFNVFDSDDMDELGMGDAWKRFQAGWQIGVAFNIDRFTLATSYGKDFTEISKKVKVAMPSITIGYNF